MKIFIVHSGCDRSKIDDLIANLGNQARKNEILILDNKNKLKWHRDALKMIKKADYALFVVGLESYKSDYFEDF